MDVKKRLLPLILCLALLLSGCRVRTRGDGRELPAADAAVGLADGSQTGGDAPGDPAESADGASEEIDESSERTRENPQASRKEFDENAPAEIVPGAERLLHAEGEGGGAAVLNGDAARGVSRLDADAEETASQTVAAPDAERMGVSEDAEAADSALTYFTVLLRDRMGSLYECQRANVYWETAQDHVTVHKTSPEHALILEAGAYDVSARLLPENLRVDDGWVARKNPGVIVKVVDGSVLNGGEAEAVLHALAARDGWAGIDAVRNRRMLLLSAELLEAPHLRVAAMLALAKTAAPELFADVDPGDALRMLVEEAAGAPPAGTYFYTATD